MNEVIELHDSVLDATMYYKGETLLSFSPAYVHRSAGSPGVDPGSVWLKDVALKITETSLPDVHSLPATVVDGSILIGSTLHDNLVPAGGDFEGPIELRLQFASFEKLVLRGHSLTITLESEGQYVEQFSPET